MFRFNLEQTVFICSKERVKHAQYATMENNFWDDAPLTFELVNMDSI